MTVPIVKSRSFSNVSPASYVEFGAGYRHESRSGEQAIPDHGQSVLRRFSGSNTCNLLGQCGRECSYLPKHVSLI